MRASLLLRSVVGWVLLSAIGVAGACASSSGGQSSPCEQFCSHLRAGSDCQGLSASQCVAECKTTASSCPAQADAMLSCLSTLPIACVAPGQAIAAPKGAAAPDPVYVTSGSSTLEVQDATCAELATAFTTCAPVGSGGNGGSVFDAGSGGVGGSSGTGASGGSGGTSGNGGVGGSGGSGGTSNCPPTHPYHCPASGSCWTEPTDCSSVKDCGGDNVGCTEQEAALGYVVDCAFPACVPTAGSCTDPSYPVYCPARHGAWPDCYTPGTQCNTVVYCDGIGAKACSQANQAVDCAANKCLTPKVAESTNATCSNTIDDDGNNFIDCKDFHCLANPTLTVCNGEVDDVACSNGKDDDGNGFMDCQDFACQISPSVTKCSSETGEAECHDSLDNDGDGKIDCVDPSCYGSPFTTCP
jgi:hypothetical protein